MRILADANIHGEIVRHLRGERHDVSWIADLASDPGDVAVLQLAVAEQRVLITHDKDFGRLVVVQGLTHRGIVLAEIAPGIDRQIHLIAACVSAQSALLERGAFLRRMRDGSVRILGQGELR